MCWVISAARAFAPSLDRLKAQGELSPEGFVDSCLDLIGPLDVEPEVRQRLVAHASEGGALRWGTEQEASTSSEAGRGDAATDRLRARIPVLLTYG